MIFHVLPENDSEPHLQESTCVCQPRVIVVENGNMIIVHNAFDGREGLELANEILNTK